jgi:hypothetical protein
MSCYFRHMKDILDEAGITVNPSMNIGVRIPAKYGNYVFSIRNLEAAANTIPIISNTVI